MIWDTNLLWKKAKLYMERAFAEDAESELCIFWASLGLEFLARCALAGVHPCLLADPQDGGNLLYACGYPTKNAPRSIPMKTVLLRVLVVVENFTSEELAFCARLSEARNTELHTGEPSFSTLSSGEWLPSFFKCCDILLASRQRTLEDLFGRSTAKSARKHIEATEKRLKAEAIHLIKQARETFMARPARERLEAITASQESAANVYETQGRRAARCPACEGTLVYVGEMARHLEPRTTADAVVVRKVYLPHMLQCPSCGLEAKGSGLLHAMGIGDEWTVEEEVDPVDYYGIDPSHWAEPDYGND